MNSKKKNKNRQNKPPNPTPPQKKEELADPVSLPEEKNISAVEERVPNIVSENVPVEVKEPEEIPKKPKRNRGKNKKDGDKSDKEEDIISEEPALEPEIQPSKDEVVDTNIAPTARKKKNKNKKNVEAVQEEKIEEKDILSDEVEESANALQKEHASEETEADTKSSKKKNKKKKNRNDSEKSEKEQVSCTSAFQNLLVEDDKVCRDKITATTDDRSVSEATVKEPKTTTQESPIDVKPQEGGIQKDDSHKNKKKNKKDKKVTSGDHTKSAEDKPEIVKIEKISTPSDEEEPIVKENLEQDTTEVSVPSTSAVHEKSSTLKAKIAKPVEKKKKGKGNSEKTFEETEGRVENVKNIEAEPTTATVPSPSEDIDLLPFVTLDETVSETNTSPDWQEEVKMNEGNGPLIGCEESNDLSQTTRNDNHDKNKRMKRSPKPQRRTGTVISPDITDQILSEDGKNSVIKEGDTACTFSPSTELKSDEQTVQPAVLQAPDDKIEHIVSTGREKGQKGKKAAKPQRRNEESEISKDTPQPGVSKTHEDTKPEEMCSLEVSQLKTDISVENTEVKKDDIEHIKTSDVEKRQNRKKSPKPRIDSEIASGSKSKTEKLKKNTINIEDIIIIQAEVVSDEKVKNKDTFIACEGNVESQKNIENMEVEYHSQKSTKRKKSPKPPQRKTTEVPPTADVKVMESEAEIQMPITPKPDDTKCSPNIVPVEQDKSTADTLPSPSDITPDFIEYPRCSSEQLIDTNNNMVIQEISHVDTKLAVPIVIPETPFIQSTNVPSPELFLSGIKVTEIQTAKKRSDEKTDLKSKVMEVNQDMEELRLSIERSLAELTSLDKIDKETEKEMDNEKTDNVEKAKLEKISNVPKEEKQSHLHTVTEEQLSQEPICPERKDRKGKSKSKKKGKQDTASSLTSQSSSTVANTKESTQSQDTKKEESGKSDQKSNTTQEKGKQQSIGTIDNNNDDSIINPSHSDNISADFEPIENFEDAMTSSVDDVNKTFEIIANEASPRLNTSQNNPEINIIAPQEDDKDSRQDKKKSVSPPKNLLGHPDIPVPSSKTDYKKEKNKTPNCRQAKVKIKDCNQVEIEIDKSKQSKESQTENKRKFLNPKNANESICVTNKNEDYVYKYSFRKVFLQCACHVCKKDLTQARVPCSFCSLIFYCSQKHKDEDHAQHQSLCFAVSTIGHLKNQKFIYADALNVTGYNYRLLRMQMIVSCEKVLKRRLAPWEQEALLYPRICADPACREWTQDKLKDCEGCGQISYCSDSDHLPKGHGRWCKSYNLYRALVRHQQTLGRLEPKLPTRVVDLAPLPNNINEVLAAMYEERIDMNDIEYAALTQLATAPLTALYCLQAYNKANSTVNGLTKKTTLTLHIVGAELQFEADVLNKWEVFLLHLVPGVKELRVVLVGPDLNPSNLPLDLLGKIKLCGNCQLNKRRVIFSFQDKRTYHEFWASDDFTASDLVCAFNPSIQRYSAYNGKDTWPSTIPCILKQKTPFAITSYTLSELTSDLLRIQECAGVGYSVVYPPKTNSFASVRPDRNFISDDEAPLLFKNQCVTVVCGV